MDRMIRCGGRAAALSCVFRRTVILPFIGCGSGGESPKAGPPLRGNSKAPQAAKECPPRAGCGNKHSMLIPFRGTSPRCHPSVFVADGAKIIGDVEIGEDASVWFNTVVRGDINRIRIGRGTNVQDNSTLHVTADHPLAIGSFVTIGHGAVVHGCVVEDLCLVGIGAILLDGAVVGRGSVIGAGSVVAPGVAIPPHALVLGVPGKAVRVLAPETIEANRGTAERYIGYARGYRR
jgi:gamma-carbonic anhydrase